MTLLNVSCLCTLWVLRQDDKVLLEVDAVGWENRVLLTRNQAEELANVLVEYPWDKINVKVGKDVLVLPRDSDMLLVVGNARILLDDAQADQVSVALSEASGHYVGGRSENKAPAKRKTGARRTVIADVAWGDAKSGNRKPATKRKTAIRKAPSRRKSVSKTSYRR